MSRRRPAESATSGGSYAAPEPEIKPYPNFHACRIRDPEKYNRFRTSSETIEGGDYDGKEITIIFGRHAQTEEWSLTSYRMSVEDWTEAQARSFCRDHNGILFESATGESMADDQTASATATMTAADTAIRRLRLARMRLALKVNQ